MALPVVAIVGRPNVGKSSLLNCLAGRMVSIVEPTAGVTRDRVSEVVSLDDERYFELVDTGGYGIEDVDDLTKHIERQIFIAVDQAMLILFVVDALDGIMPLDKEVARLLRKHSDRVILIANKVDGIAQEPTAAEFVRLGYGEPHNLSAIHRHGRRDLTDLIAERLSGQQGEAPARAIMKVALVGKRNTGKSTFINALAGEERVIASERPGTTRDAIDVTFEQAGRTFVAIDTAGVRKINKMDNAIEFYGYTRAERSIRRADVVLLFIDALVPVGRVDKRLVSLIRSEFKPCVIVVNKWDLAIERTSTEEYGAYLERVFPELAYAPIVFTTATDDHNVDAAIDVAWSLFKQANLRVGTGQLNAVLSAITAERGPSAKRGTKSPRIYYGTQVAVMPPTVVLFVNSPASFSENYRRFLLNRFREGLPFAEVPVRLVVRARRGGHSTPPT
ncbi:MAG: ribosome biogenesis GTPase Der [bacterium]|nr:ribosome biogenesis GTPase Der [bacterium]